MIIIDAFFRFSGIGLLLLIALIALRDNRSAQSTPFLVLACISTASLFLGYAPDALRLNGWAFAIARLMDVPHLIFVWLFALSLFSSNFRLSRGHFIVSALYCMPILWIRLAANFEVPPAPPWLVQFVSVMSLAVAGHLCLSTLYGRKDDLVASRRQSRVMFVLVIVLVTVSAALSEAFGVQGSSLKLETVKVLTIWPAVAWAAYWMTSFNSIAVNFAHEEHAAPDLDVRDAKLHDRLLEEMSEGAAHQEENLTIQTLARRLGVTQHRLRAFINQALGYRNFSTFLNDHRIDAVKQEFAKPQNAHLPILTIALDCGFRSISSFNRAFKEREGMTPKEYRQKLKSRTRDD